MDEDDSIHAYTDGSCSRRNGEFPGGWAFIAIHGAREFIRYGYKFPTTVNEMELTAILRVLEFVRITKHPLIIYTDSEYSKNSLMKWCRGWAAQGWVTATGTPVKNKELIAEIVELLDKHRKVRNVNIVWIRGHSGNLKNEQADKYAGQAREDKSTNWTEKDASRV